MNKKEKKYYLELLNKKREDIVKNLGSLREGIESSEKGIPTHIADYGTDEFEKGLGIDISDEEVKILKNINIAVAKISDNTYGICEECSKKIAISRLKALPYARYCIKCQREKEKGDK